MRKFAETTEQLAMHCAFALDHIRSVLRAEPSVKSKLYRATAERAAVLSGMKGLNPLVEESLVILAAGGLSPERLPFGTKARLELYDTMYDNRIRRLASIGLRRPKPKSCPKCTHRTSCNDFIGIRM